MNYWSLNKQSSQTFRHRLEKLVFNYVDVQSSERNKFEQLMVLTNYLISYTVIFVLIMQSLARQFINTVDRNTALTTQRLTFLEMDATTEKAIMVLFSARLAFAVLYVPFQKVYFLMASKILLIANLFMSEFQTSAQQFLPIEILVLFVEVFALAIWAYKIQTRMVHFDSRLDAAKPFAKETLILLTCFLMRRLQKISFSQTIFNGFQITFKLSAFQIESAQLMFLCLCLTLLVDLFDNLYKKDLKRLILGLDFAFLTLTASWIVCIKTADQHVANSNYIILFVSLVVMQLAVVFNKDDFRILYEIQGNNLHDLGENKLIEYFETLRRLIKDDEIPGSQKNVEIIKFIQFHKKSCMYPACPFTKRFNMADSVFLKSQLIEEYMIKVLEQLSKTRPKIRAYLIFYFSPRDKVFRYLTGRQTYERREIWRINQMKRQMSNEIRILEAQMIQKTATDLIKEYLACGSKYFKILMNEHVNGGNLIFYGGRMLELIEKIETMKENSINFTQSVRILLNNFSSRLINDATTQILETVVDPPFLINRTTEVGPTMIVSAEPQNFLRIIDANTAFTKEFYYPKEVFLSLTTIDLLPEQIKVKHREHFDRVSKKTDFDGKKDFPTSLFVTNMNGFMSFFIAVVYLLNSIKGRMWCVSIEITHKMNAIMLVAMEKNGVVMGISEMAVFHGLKTTDKGKQLTEQFHNKLKTKQAGSSKYNCYTVQSEERIFANSDFQFGSAKEVLIVQEFSAFGLTYFLVEIKEANEQNLAKSRSSAMKSSKLVEQSERKLKFLEADQQLNYVPKHQFFYHSDGQFRTQQQDEDSIKAKFSRQQEKKTTFVEIKGELSEGISEMVLIQNRLDYLENIEQEKDFMPAPMAQMEKREQGLKNFNLSLDFFKQSLQEREQTTPKWLRGARIFFVLMAVILISILIASWMLKTKMIQKSTQHTNIMDGIQQMQSNYIELSYLMLSAKYYNPQVRLDLRRRIIETNNYIETSSVAIYSMDSGVEKYLGKANTIKAISSYSIAISNLVEVNEKDLIGFDEQPVLKNLLLHIVPVFESLIREQLQLLDVSLNSSSNLALFIVFSILLLTVFAWVYFTSQHTSKLKNNIIKIMAKMSDNIFQREMVKLKLFEEYLYFGKDIYEEDDLQFFMKHTKTKDFEAALTKPLKATVGSKGTLRSSNKIIIQWRSAKHQSGDIQSNMLVRKKLDGELTTSTKMEHMQETEQLEEQQEEKRFVKKLVNQQQTHCVKVFTLCWILFVWGLSFMFYNSIEKYSITSKRMIRIDNNLMKIQIQADTLWTMLNMLPYDDNLLSYHQASFFTAQHQFRKEVSKMIFENELSSQFAAFYTEIWMDNCCRFIEGRLPGCRTVIGGALEEGGDQIVSYIGRKSDYLKNLKLEKSDLQSSQMAKEVANMGLEYLTEVVAINKEMLKKELTEMEKKFERQQMIEFTVLVIGMGLMAVVYKLVSGENDKLIKSQKLFKLIEFKSLQKNKELKFYFKKNYYDKIYK